MNQQTIHLPSGETITVTVQEARPLEQWTEVEIAEAIESQRIYRRRVQSRKGQEAVEVRAQTHVEISRLRAELRRRKKEGVPCPACDGVGSICVEPGGGRVYCDGCKLGLEFALGNKRMGMDNAALWLEEWPDNEDSDVVSENLTRLTAEYDEIRAKLDLLRAR